jgi:uncharacterized protein YbjT (DUF2867 family)
MKKVLIAGASGMIGQLIVQNCVQSQDVSSIISLVRKPSSTAHPKLKEVAVSNFKTYDKSAEEFNGVDAAFFCIGVYTGQTSDAKFKEITVDYAVNFAKALKNRSHLAKLCLLSGAGADRTEKSRASFARYKGEAENKISALDIEFYAFRPGYIYPVTPRKEPNLMYRLMRLFYPIIRLGGNSIKSTELASAMFNVGLAGAHTEILENRDIMKYI